MKKTFTYIFILILLIIAIIVIYNIVNKKEMNKFTFPSTCTAKNSTDYKELDTILLVATNKILKIDTIDLHIFYMSTNNLNTSDIEIAGFIEKVIFKPHTYSVFVSKNLPLSIEEFVSHEITHLYQMETGDLMQLKNAAFYKGKYINYLIVPYKNREFEKEAFNKQDSIENQLKKLLYK